MVSIDEQLNSLLVELNRSFLQYAFEAWPYAGDKSEAAARIRELALLQQQDVGVLCEVLIERQWPVDFGTFPTEYTASQYNSLESLTRLLHESQVIALDRFDHVAQACESDSFVTEVLKQLRQNEQAILDELASIQSGSNR